MHAFKSINHNIESKNCRFFELESFCHSVYSESQLFLFHNEKSSRRRP